MRGWVSSDLACSGRSPMGVSLFAGSRGRRIRGDHHLCTQADSRGLEWCRSAYQRLHGGNAGGGWDETHRGGDEEAGETS